MAPLPLPSVGNADFYGINKDNELFLDGNISLYVGTVDSYQRGSRGRYGKKLFYRQSDSWLLCYKVLCKVRAQFA